MREYKASLSYAIVSPIKMELVAKMVRWKSVKNALVLLDFLPKKAGHILAKVISSANANMLTWEGSHANDAIISTIDVGKGPSIKRMKFTSRARIYGYIRHRSFVRVVLSVK